MVSQLDLERGWQLFKLDPHRVLYLGFAAEQPEQRCRYRVDTIDVACVQGKAADGGMAFHGGAEPPDERGTDLGGQYKVQVRLSDQSLGGLCSCHALNTNTRRPQTLLHDVTVWKRHAAIPAGNQQEMVAPSPSTLWASTLPPCASTRCRTIARPSPVPPSSRLRARSAR